MANDTLDESGIKADANLGDAWKQAAPGLFPAKPPVSAPTTHLEDLAQGTLKGRFSQAIYAGVLMEAEPPGSPPMGTQKIPDSLDNLEPTGSLGPNYKGLNNDEIRKKYEQMNPGLKR